METGKIELKDGRILSYSIYGPASGKTLLYFHGTPSSSKEIELLKAFEIDPEVLLKDAQVQILAIDRPGMGNSTFNPKGNFKTFAQDVNELLDEFQIDQAPILCWSGGGTYAISMAYHFPDRVNAVYVICGFTRKFDQEVMRAMGFNKWYFIMAKKWPRVLKSTMSILRKKRINRFLPQKYTGLSYVDYALLNDPEHISHVAEVTLKQACVQGTTGAVYEAANYFEEPGYDLSSVSTPIHYWWGTKDMSVVILHAQEVEMRAKNVTLYYREGEGHFSLYINSWAEIIQMIGSEK